jgi:DNA-binding CsgD family transcriptional regulator
MDKLARRAFASGGIEARLSDRELEVLELLGSGLGSREIADRLGLSIKTIESHREHIKGKLGLTRAAQLVTHAFNWRQDATGAP